MQSVASGQRLCIAAVCALAAMATSSALADFTFSMDVSDVRYFTDTNSPPGFAVITDATLASAQLGNGVRVTGTTNDGARTDRAFTLSGSQFVNGANSTGSRMVASGLITSGTLNTDQFLRGDFNLVATLTGATTSYVSIGAAVRLELFNDSNGLTDYVTGFSMARGLPGLFGGETVSMSDVFDTPTIGAMLGSIPDYNVARWTAELFFYWSDPAGDDQFTVYIPDGSVDYSIIPAPAPLALLACFLVRRRP